MPWTLQRKYAVTLAVLFGLPQVVGGAAGGMLAYREAIGRLESGQRALAQVAAAEVGEHLGRLHEALRSSVVKFDGDGPAGDEALRIELASLLRHHAEIGALRWIDPDGRERASLRRYGLDVDAPAEDAAALRQRARRDAQAAAVWFRKGSEPHVSLAMAGPTGSVLAADLNLAPLRARLALGGGAAYVVDGQGRLVLHPDAGRMLERAETASLPQVRRALAAAGEPVVGAGVDTRGEAVIAAGAPVPLVGWAAIAEQPHAQALRPAVGQVLRSLGLAGLGLAAALVASVLLARRLTEPIRAIEAGARRLGEGHYGERIELRTGDELQSLAERFNAMATRLQQTYAEQERVIDERTHALALAVEARNRFLAAASHDLRQPLHALGLFTGQLRALPLAGDAQALARQVERSVQALQLLVEDLLDLSQLEAGAVQPAPVDLALADLFEPLALVLGPIARERGLRLRLRPGGLWVRSDARLLARILQNLATNALRYTPRGGVLVAARRRGADVELLVADTGIGIAPDQQALVFREFHRAAPADGVPGLGLGLALVQRFAALLDHPVTLASEPGRGTCVRLRLPAGSPRAADPAVPTDAEPLQGCRVLVVDDDPDARAALAGQLQAWGCEVAEAGDPAHALASATARPPALVLCDLHLGAGASGLDLLERLRAGVPGWQGAVVSGAADAAARARVGAAGWPLLTKPVAAARLRALAEQLLRAGRAGAVRGSSPPPPPSA